MAGMKTSSAGISNTLLLIQVTKEDMLRAAADKRNAPLAGALGSLAQSLDAMEKCTADITSLETMRITVSGLTQLSEAFNFLVENNKCSTLFAGQSVIDLKACDQRMQNATVFLEEFNPFVKPKH